MIEESNDPGLDIRIRIQELCWKQIVQLKVECDYIRRYQASHRWWVTRIEVAKAVLSVVALPDWVGVTWMQQRLAEGAQRPTYAGMPFLRGGD